MSTEKKNLEPGLPPLLPETKTVMDTLMAADLIKKALQLAVDQDDLCLQEQIAITETPSSPFGEEIRGKDFVERFTKLGLLDVHMDEVGNVIGRRPGVGPEPRTKLIISAHLDTVFAKDTNFKVRQEGNRFYAPSIGDDSRGLAGLLQVIRMFQELKIQTLGDIIFVATVGEEGEGDLRGVKHLFRDPNVDVDAFMSLDWCDPSDAIVGATGSLRYRVSFDGPGGHSYLGFGQPSAIHALMRTGKVLCDLEVPKDPKTTYTVGVVKGGTTVNSIAAHCEVEIDMRSFDNKCLLALEAEILSKFDEAVAEENASWTITDPERILKVTKTAIGDRPAGTRPHDCPVLQVARSAQKVLGIELTQYGRSSTDANAPMSENIPSTCLCSGGHAENAHNVKEFFEMIDTHLGPQLLTLAALSLVGVEDEEPLLPKKL